MFREVARRTEVNGKAVASLREARNDRYKTMSVIAARSRVTVKNEDFEKFCLSDDSLLLTDACTVEEFSIELTLGDYWDSNTSRDVATMYEIEGDDITIPAKGNVVVEVAEFISLPSNMYGIVIPTGSLLLEQGIVIAATKIEPWFSNRLRLMLFNSSRISRSIRKGTPLASAVFFRTERTVRLLIVPCVRSHQIKKTPTNFERTRAYLREHAREIVMMILVPLLAAVLGGLAGAYFSAQSASTTAEAAPPAPTVPRVQTAKPEERRR